MVLRDAGKPASHNKNYINDIGFIESVIPCGIYFCKFNRRLDSTFISMRGE